MALCLLLTTFCCALAVFQSGYSSSSLNVTQKIVEKFIQEVFQKRFNVELTVHATTTLFTVVVSMFYVGALVGALSVSWVAERIGRKRGLIYPQIFSVVAAILMGCCKSALSYEMLLIGRLSIGISSGIGIGMATLYCGEIAPINIRGKLLLIKSVGNTLGAFTAYVLGLPNLLGGEDTWPVLLAFVAVPSLLQCMILPFMPESPRYLILSKGEKENAEDELKKLRNTDDVGNEMKQIQAEEENNDAEMNYTIWQLLTSAKLRLSLMICVALFLSDAMSGYTALQFYSTSIFEDAGLEASKSQYATISLGGIRLIMTVVAIYLIEKFGRRTLHLIGLAGLVISSIMITISLQYTSIEVMKVLLITSALLFVAFFSIGVSVVPFIAVAELFTQGPRSAAVSVGVFVYVLGALFISLVYPQMQLSLMNYSFLPFVIVEVVLFVILLFYFPETKNRTSTQISLLFQEPNATTTVLGFKKIITEPLLTSKSYANYGTDITSS